MAGGQGKSGNWLAYSCRQLKLLWDCQVWTVVAVSLKWKKCIKLRSGVTSACGSTWSAAALQCHSTEYFPMHQRSQLGVCMACLRKGVLEAALFPMVTETENG